MTIYQRGQTWWVRERKNAAGVQIPNHSTEMRDKKLAQRYANSLDLLAEWKPKKEADAKEGLSLPDALKEYLDPKDANQKRKLGDQTRELYVQTLGNEYIPALKAMGVTHLAEVKSQHAHVVMDGWKATVKEIKKSRHGRQKHNLGWRTINGRLRTCKTFHNWFMHRIEDLRNPWVTVKPLTKEWKGFEDVVADNWKNKGQLVKPDGVATLPLDLDGTDKNWQAIRTNLMPFLRSRGERFQTNQLAKDPERFLAFVELLYATGLRRGDATVFIKDNILPSETGFTYRTKQTKTKTHVTTFLSRTLAEKLRSFAPLPWRGNPSYPGAGQYIFYDGSEVSIKLYMNNKINQPLRQLGQYLEIPDSLRPHRFRDSFAVMRMDWGMDLKDISRMLGHEDIRTTQKHYLPYIESSERAIERRNAKAVAQYLKDYRGAEKAQGLLVAA